MSDAVNCKSCFGTGQKVEVTPAKFGHLLPPYRPCPHCSGTGIKRGEPTKP